MSPPSTPVASLPPVWKEDCLTDPRIRYCKTNSGGGRMRSAPFHIEHLGKIRKPLRLGTPSRNPTGLTMMEGRTYQVRGGISVFDEKRTDGRSRNAPDSIKFPRLYYGKKVSRLADDAPGDRST